MSTPTPTQQLVDAWVPLSVALNSIHRSMGQPDLYPFVLSPAVVGKLEFIHKLIYDAKSFDPPASEKKASE